MPPPDDESKAVGELEAPTVVPLTAEALAIHEALLRNQANANREQRIIELRTLLEKHMVNIDCDGNLIGAGPGGVAADVLRQGSSPVLLPLLLSHVENLPAQVSAIPPASLFDNLFRLIIVGPEDSGKSSLLRRFTGQRFIGRHCLNGPVSVGSRTLEADGHVIKLQMWDLSGYDRFRSIIRAYYRGAAGGLLVYDVTCRESFDSVSNWLREVRFDNPELSLALVGNKCDRLADRRVSHEEGYAFARRNGLLFMETSAETGRGVDEVFVTTARMMHARHSAETHAKLNSHNYWLSWFGCCVSSRQSCR